MPHTTEAVGQAWLSNTHLQGQPIVQLSPTCLSNTRHTTGVIEGQSASENYALKNSLSSAAQRNGESAMSVPATLYERIPTAASFWSMAWSFAISSADV